MRDPERLTHQEENRAAWVERGLARLAEKVKARDWRRALHDLDDLRVTLAKLADEGVGSVGVRGDRPLGGTLATHADAPAANDGEG